MYIVPNLGCQRFTQQKYVLVWINSIKRIKLVFCMVWNQTYNDNNLNTKMNKYRLNVRDTPLKPRETERLLKSRSFYKVFNKGGILLFVTKSK